MFSGLLIRQIGLVFHTAFLARVGHPQGARREEELFRAKLDDRLARRRFVKPRMEKTRKPPGSIAYS